MMSRVTRTSNVYCNLKESPAEHPFPIEELYKNGNIEKLLDGNIIQICTRIGDVFSKENLEYDAGFMKKIRIEDFANHSKVRESRYDPDVYLSKIKEAIDNKKSSIDL